MTPEQIKFRRNGIGGSDVSRIALGVYGGPYALYCEKVGLAPAAEETEPMIWGRRFEAEIASEYAKRTGRRLCVDDAPMSIRTDFGFPMISNVDRLIIPDEAGENQTRPWGVYEGKFLSVYSDAGKQARRGEIPDVYFLQPQFYMLARNLEWGALAILVGNTHFFYQDIERDEDTLDLVLELCREFWRRVELRDPPPVDGSEYTADLLKRMYPSDTGQVISLDGEAAEAAVALQEAKAKKSFYEAVETAHANIVKAAIGGASAAYVPGWDKPITWKQSRGYEKLDADAVKAADPKLYERCLVPVTGNRPLIVPKAKE